MLTYCILHYKNCNVTINCVNSLIEANKDDCDYSITIIDNGSNNGSGQKLCDYYQGNPRVIVLINDLNLGFARGNNIAYKYAKENLYSDIIVAMNSDILVDSKFSAKLIREQVHLSGSDVLSPDILTPNGIHQSPLALKEFSVAHYLMTYFKNLFLIILLSIPYYRISFFERYAVKKNIKLSKKLTIPQFDRSDFIPHGACVIYANKWVVNESFAFVPKTFLYAEENFLYEYCKNKEYKLYFSEVLKIVHLGSSTIESEHKTGINTLIFKAKEQNKSMLKLIRYKLFNK